MTAHVAPLPSSTSANLADEASPLTRRGRWRLEVTVAAGSTVAAAGPTVAVSRVNLAGKRACLNPDLFGDPGTYLGPAIRALGAEVPPRGASALAESGRLFGIRRVIAAAEGPQQISASDRDTQIGVARSQPQSIRTRRVVSHHRKNPTDILRLTEERAEGCRTASTATSLPPCRPSGPAARRLSLHATDHGRGTRAPGHICDTRCRLHRGMRQSPVCST